MIFFLIISIFCIIFTELLNIKILQHRTGDLLAILMFCIICFNYRNADISMYEDYYYQSGILFHMSSNTDDLSRLIDYFSQIRNFGFLLVNNIFWGSGFSFAEFRVTTLGILFLLTFIFIRKLTDKYECVLLLYLIYPFSFDIIQTKNFYIEVMVLWAFYLYTYSRRNNNFKYVFMTAISSIFHNISLIYIPYIFIAKVYRYRAFKILVILIIGTFPFVASFIKESSWPILLSLFNEVDTFQHYVIYAEMNTETYMYLAHWGFVIIFTVIAFFMYHRISESHSSCDKRLFKNIYIMWMYFCFLVPIFAINVDLLRIPRNFILPIYICIANCLEYKIKYSKIIFLMALVVLSLYFYKVSGGMEILDDILKYNYVFDIIDNY